MTQRSLTKGIDAPSESPIVLVVDDDPSVREGLSRLFRSVGLDPKSFASAAELLQHKLPEAPSCKASPAAAIADAACTPTIAGATPLRDIIAPAKRWSRAVASFASMSAASRSTTPSRKPSSPRWSPPGSPQPSPPPSDSRRIARLRSSRGGSPRNARATKPSAPSGAIAPSIPKTVSWRAASSASGRNP